MFSQIWRRVSTSWNFKNFDARSWRIRFPFALFSLHLWDGHSKRGIKTLAVTSCKVQNNCFLTLIQSFQIELRNRVKMLMYATSVQKIVYSTSLSGFIPNCSRIIYYRSSTYQGYNQKESLKRDQYLVYLKTTFFTCINSNLHQGLHIRAASHNSRYFHKLPNVGCLHLPYCEWSHLWECLDVNLTTMPKHNHF